MFCGTNKNSQKNSSSLEIMYFGFQKDRKHILQNLPKSGLVHTEYNYAYQTTLRFW
jgi:hypothetical protein